MQSVLWFFLILHTSAVSPDDSTRSDESEKSLEPQSPLLGLADSIYNKQWLCECIIGEAVDKFLDEGTYYKFPTPDQKYLECKKSTDEKKREYIRIALVGLPFSSTTFPMRLSNGKVVNLPVPAKENLSTVVAGHQAEFDVQDELCVTNRICRNLFNIVKFSNYDTEKDPKKYGEKFSHCMDLFNYLKIKYIQEKNLDENVLKKEGGLCVRCGEKEIKLRVPPQVNDLNYNAISMGYMPSELKYPIENKECNKDSVEQPAESQNPYRDSYDNVVAELNSLFGKRSKGEEIFGQDDSEKEVSNSEFGVNSHAVREDSKLNDKSSISETVHEKIQGGKTKGLQHIPGYIADNEKVSMEELPLGKPSDHGSLSHREETFRNADNRPGNAAERMQATKTVPPKNMSISSDSQTLARNDHGETNEYVQDQESITRIPPSLEIKEIESENQTPDTSQWSPAFLLILSTSTASSDESTKQEEAGSSSESQAPIFALADEIYNKQRECESIIGAAVEKVLDEGVYPVFPSPDDSYFQCKRILNEKKREYIKTGLLGLDYYSTVFPMRLSYGRVVILQVPDDEQPLEGADQAEFYVQEELCATNKICLNIIDKKYSKYDAENDLKKQTDKLSQCTALLNDLKLKYIRTKKLDENELKKEGGLSVLCAERAIMFRLPPQMNDLDYYTTSHSMGSVASKVMSGTENAEDNKNSVGESTDYHNPYSGVIAELNNLVEKKKEDQNISEDSNSEKNIIIPEPKVVDDPKKGDVESNDNTSTSETTPQEVTTDSSTTENLNSGLSPTETEISANGNVSEKSLKRLEPNGDVGLPHKDNLVSDSASSGDKSVPEIISTKTEAPENNSLTGDNKTSVNENEKTDSKSKKNKKSKSKKGSKPVKTKDDENFDLLTYQVNVVSKNGEGNVVRIHASGRIKKTESGIPAPPRQLSGGLGSKSEDGLSAGKPELIHKNIRQVYPLEQSDETKPIRRVHSLEENIIMKENDCKELLKFGEQLLKHKMLSSLINFEDQYNKCIEKLNDLKKMYIKENKLDVLSHRNIFPMTLPSGDQKLILLPTQFLKTGLVESLSPPQSKHDVFEADELSHKIDASENLSFQSRKPFDDPAFIPNEVFLESLKQGSASPDTSTLSKVASMLHMNGGHNDRKIAE